MVFLRHIAGEYNISDWRTCMYMLGDKTAWYADKIEQFLPILSCFQSHREQRVYRSYTVYGWWCYTWGRHEALPIPSVYGGRVIHFNTRQDLAAAKRVLPRLHVYHIWGSEFQDSGWIQSRLQSVLFLSESLLCLYYNSVTWMTLCSSLAIT